MDINFTGCQKSSKCSRRAFGWFLTARGRIFLALLIKFLKIQPRDKVVDQLVFREFKCVSKGFIRDAIQERKGVAGEMFRILKFLTRTCQRFWQSASNMFCLATTLALNFYKSKMSQWSFEKDCKWSKIFRKAIQDVFWTFLKESLSNKKPIAL